MTQPLLLDAHYSGLNAGGVLVLGVLLLAGLAGCIWWARWLASSFRSPEEQARKLLRKEQVQQRRAVSRVPLTAAQATQQTGARRGCGRLFLFFGLVVLVWLVLAMYQQR